jgi:hypothetical protein
MTRPIVNMRRAVSLVEMLVIMSGCTVILTTGATLIHRAMRADLESRAFYDIERSALRLERQFRQDVHEAIAAEATNQPGEDGVFLRLTFPGHQAVEYRQAGDSIMRTLSAGDRVRSRNEFVFNRAGELDIREEVAPRRLILTIASAPNEPPSGGHRELARYLETPVSVRVEACLGRDLRPAGLLAGEGASQ